ncbi:hypothetical protein TRFO_38903 [Tritrichomonas foetus]|uniref:Uncharacterized protein n=1 Tax=Tritrichomonas foetus TaxID=1144522 RepID=A0A1J4J6W5_9EUKA|nr:hypothetical protein TRFO_38903 [Tritrichomonas foetus]|eukprot:OHS94928.1 hypothetical protein TRFO_38903 [Tritrichomonas foetus]
MPDLLQSRKSNRKSMKNNINDLDSDEMNSLLTQILNSGFTQDDLLNEQSDTAFNDDGQYDEENGLDDFKRFWFWLGKGTKYPHGRPVPQTNSFQSKEKLNHHTNAKHHSTHHAKHHRRLIK